MARWQRKRNPYRSAGRLIATGVNAYRVARRAFSGRTGTRNLKFAGSPITGESDFRTTYRRKPMPRKKKKQWRKFTKRVQAVQLKGSGSQFLVNLRQQRVLSNVNGGKQTFTSIHTACGLTGLGGAGGTDDFLTIAQRVVAASQVPGVALDNVKFVVSGWMVETQIVNNGTNTAYIDMYYWRASKKVPQFMDATQVSAANIFEKGFSDMAANFPGGGSSLDAFDYGATPYQNPQFSRTMKIWKKTRVKLAPGGVTQVETRSGKNYFRTWSIDEDYGMDTCTEGIFMITYGIPGAVQPPNPINTSTPVDLSFSTNANYTYKILERNVLTAGTNAP